MDLESARFIHHGFKIRDMNKNKKYSLSFDSCARLPDQNFEFTGLLLNNYINSICTAIHGSVVVKAGQYRPQLKFAQDYDNLLRAAALSPPIFINSNLSVYRTHQGQDSKALYLTGL